MDIQQVREALQAGQHVTRKKMKFKKSFLFLLTSCGKQYLFIRSVRPHSGELADSPYSMDWDDINATDWRITK